MYKYFVSFTFVTDSGRGFGNTVAQANVKITDLGSVDEMYEWINHMQIGIENTNIGAENVIILNFQLLDN